MSDFFYLRVRGQVHGPYGTEQIQQLVRQGKVSRYHEISDDGNTWKKASDYAEFFPRSQSPVQKDSRPQVDDAVGMASSGANPYIPQTTSSPYAPNSVWRVARNNQELQPVQYSELQQMARNGHLSPGDQVWTSGMPQWSTAGEIPGLFAANAGVPMGENSMSMPSQSMNGAYAQNLGNANVGGNHSGDLGENLWPTMTRCVNCGQSVLKTMPACPHCGRWVYGETPKKRSTYVVLGFFLGFFGVHNFYAERTGYAIGQLILGLTVILAPISLIWTNLEILIVKQDGKGRPFI